MSTMVSVIIPARNEAENIGEVLAALAALKYDRRCLEIIVVDNGSTDRTADIARGRGATVLPFPGGKTIAQVRNHGVKHARGGTLAFLDADCVVAEDWLLQGMAWLRDGVGAVGSRPVAPESGRTWVQHYWSMVLPRSVGDAIPVAWLSSSNMLVARSVFERVNGFDEGLATHEDVDLGMRLSLHATLIYDPRVKASHLREPRTLAELFRSEVWHGKGYSLRCLREWRLKDRLCLISLLYLLAMVALVPALLLKQVVLAALCFCCLLGVPLVMTVRNVGRVKTLTGLARCYLINACYVTARTYSLLLAAKTVAMGG